MSTSAQPSVVTAAPPTTAAPPAPRLSHHATHRLMVLPALVLFGLFALLPMAIVVVLSFTRWDGLTSPAWAGTANWTHLLTSPVTRHAMWLSLQVVVLSWVIQTPISLLLGVFLAGRQRYRAVLAVIFFIPLLLSSVAIALAFRYLLDPNFGLTQSWHTAPLSWLNHDWLGDQRLVLYTVIFVISWQFIPFHTLLYQAGARQIPASMYEASMIDGAGRVQQFWGITLPQLRNTIVTSSTLILVGSLTYFDLVFVLTGGGPGYATRLLPLDMYITGFQDYQFGQASATATLLVIIGMLLSLGLVRFSGFAKMRSEAEGA
jgi:raffinose/stachyose/melibiose transport system permease protein